MVTADEIAAAIKAAEAGLKQADKDIAADRAGIEAQVTAAKASLDELARERSTVTAALPASVLTLFEGLVRTRKGLAIVEEKTAFASPAT